MYRVFCGFYVVSVGFFWCLWQVSMIEPTWILLWVNGCLWKWGTPLNGKGNMMINHGVCGPFFHKPNSRIGCCNPHNHHFTKGGIEVLDSWNRGSDRWNWRLMAVQPSQNIQNVTKIPSDSFRPLANIQLFVSNVYVEKSLSLNDFWIHSLYIYIYTHIYISP